MSRVNETLILNPRIEIMIGIKATRINILVKQSFAGKTKPKKMDEDIDRWLEISVCLVFIYVK